jgi:hypothetical protein
MLSRDRERGERALDDLEGAGPGAAELVVGDLASAREIRAAAASATGEGSSAISCAR